MRQVRPPGSKNETFFGKFWSKAKQDPLVPIGLLATVGVLGGGLYTMVLGTSPQLGQKFMRARVLAQGATVVMLCTGGIMMGNSTAPAKRETYEEKLLAMREERRLEERAKAARVAALTEAAPKL